MADVFLSFKGSARMRSVCSSVAPLPNSVLSPFC